MKNFVRATALVAALFLYGCARNLHPEWEEPGLAVLNKAGDCISTTPNDKDETGDLVETSHDSNGVDAYNKNQPVPLLNGFAHNDYLHKRPLYDAFGNGFTNIEADVFLLHGRLVVAHFFPYFKTGRNLESLYLRPLQQLIAQNKGRALGANYGPVILMIDVKTDANRTYKALKPLLEKYRSILTGYENGKVVHRAVIVALSGHRPMIRNEKNRLAFIDEDLLKIEPAPVDNNLFPMASCKYSKLIKWTGEGVFSDAEKRKLCNYVVMAHKMGAKVRLWASPEKKIVWDALLNCGVDLINTDHLTALKDYLAIRQLQPLSSGQSKTYADLGPASNIVSP